MTQSWLAKKDREGVKDGPDSLGNYALLNCGVPPLRIVVSSPNPHLSPRSEVVANSPPIPRGFCVLFQNSLAI